MMRLLWRVQANRICNLQSWILLRWEISRKRKWGCKWKRRKIRVNHLCNRCSLIRHSKNH